MINYREHSKMLSQKLNTKMIALVFIVSAFSGNISPAYAEFVKPHIYNINIYNKYTIYNKLNNINIINSNNKKISTSNSALRLAEKKKAVFNKNVNNVMNAIKWHESRGNYKAHSRYSSACGAYQYIRSTWNNYMGYKTACAAPKWVQDKRMRNELTTRWKQYGDWEKVIAAHYVPAWADKKWKWYRTPSGGGNRTVWRYVNLVMQKAGMK